LNQSTAQNKSPGDQPGLLLLADHCKVLNQSSTSFVDLILGKAVALLQLAFHC
jgi:hypothetical protein